MSESSVKHVPVGEKWEFDAGVVDVFPDMLERSIPQYEVMRQSVLDVAASFLDRLSGDVVDLGSSRGDAVAELVERSRADRGFWAIEQSEPMLDVLRHRFGGRENVNVRGWDLRDSEQRAWSSGASVTLSVLTLQFVPINYRQGIIRDVFRKLAPGGAFVLVEKVIGATAEHDALMVETYHALKGANGYGSEEIERKRRALEGVLVPVTAEWNEDLLRQAGFRAVDCFWRWMNFAGWVAIRD
jgi:tRNA (cmo5U34)-methyltransferase